MDEATGGVFTAEQRAVFRSAGFWMRIVGWVEVAIGGLIGLTLGLAALGVAGAGEAVGAAPSEWILAAVQGIGAVVVGTLTLAAAAAFRRAGPDAASVTEAADHLRELFERQVWVFVAVVFVIVGGVLAR